MRIGTLPAGTMGFDCNTNVSLENAKKFYDRNYRFVMRYIRQGPYHDYDIKPSEIIDVLTAGLGLGLVQHVPNPGWLPTEKFGTQRGEIAVVEAEAAGYVKTASLFFDLEGVASSTYYGDVIKCCNRWWDVVKEAKYEPGLYVGDSCGLNATQLYRNLKFKLYWGAYNLNRDTYPITRGLAMRQYAYPPKSERVAGIPFEYDEDKILGDAFGGLPSFMLPTCP